MDELPVQVFFLSPSFVSSVYLSDKYIAHIICKPFASSLLSNLSNTFKLHVEPMIFHDHWYHLLNDDRI